jgi:phenylacetate-CoA ligase
VGEHRDFDDGLTAQAELAKIQAERLQATVRYARANSAFYAEHLSGVSEQDIQALSPERLGALPFTTKDDLRAQMFRMLSKPLHEAWVYYETTGTTGRSTPCPRDNTDSLVNNTALTVCYRDVFRAHGREHVVAVLGPTEMHSTGDTFGDVCRNLGHTVVKLWPHSPVVGFPRAIEVLRELRVTAVFCTPGMALSLAKEARAAGLEPRTDFSIRAFMFTGELATPELLGNIGAEWGAAAYNCLYASQESSILAAVHGDGKLRTIPLNVCYEVIDPADGSTAPAGVGGYREGELVITHLYQGSKPLIRYRTGDMVRMYEPEASARYPSATLVPVGRVKDLISLGGHLVTAYDLESSVLGLLPGCRDYQIVIDRVEDRDRLTVRIEADWTRDVLRARQEVLRRVAERRLGCEARVERAELGAITTTGAMVSWKAARIHDTRVEPDAERRAALAIAERRSR